MRRINIINHLEEKEIEEILKQIYKIEEEDEKILKENAKLADAKEHKELEPLMINLASLGGYCYGCLAIIDALSNLKCEIITRAHGIVASAGFTLFCFGHKRIAGKNTEFMYHKMSYGNFKELHKQKNNLEVNLKVQELLDNVITKNTKISQELLDSKEKDDWSFFYDDAVRLGVITEVTED